jgi:iron-regulated transporter 1
LSFEEIALSFPAVAHQIIYSNRYLNVLSFGGLMTAYLVWLGVNYSLIGTLRGFSAVVGLLGTVAFRVSERQHGLANTGMWSIMVQFGFLALCYLSLFVRNLEFSLWLLVIGVCCSRIGLWAFDLTITQYMQQQTPEKVRGLIGGVQKSLNSFFELSTFALGLIFPDPGDFYLLVATGYTSVGIAMMLYYFGIYKKREALI